MAAGLDWRRIIFTVLTIGFALAATAILAMRFSHTFSEAIVREATKFILTGRAAPPVQVPECGAWGVQQAGTQSQTDMLLDLGKRCGLRDLIVADQQAPQSRSSARIRPPEQKMAPKPDDPVEALILKSVRPYTLLVNLPPQVEAGTAFDVDAIVQTGGDQKVENITQTAQRTLAREQIEVTPEIQIVLQGSGFEIATEDNGWRTLTRLSPSIWKWKVVASGEGEKTVAFVVRGKVRVKEDERWFDAYITNRKIMIVLPPMQRALAAAESAQKIIDALQSLWLVLSGAFAAMGTFAFRQLRRMRRQKTVEAA